MNTTHAEKVLAAEAINRLDEEFANAGCNDLEIPDTLENRELIKEYEAWNLRIPFDELKNHRDYDEVRSFNGKLQFHDGLLIYILRKITHTI